MFRNGSGPGVASSVLRVVASSVLRSIQIDIPRNHLTRKHFASILASIFDDGAAPRE